MSTKSAVLLLLSTWAVLTTLIIGMALAFESSSLASTTVNREYAHRLAPHSTASFVIHQSGLKKAILYMEGSKLKVSYATTCLGGVQVDSNVRSFDSSVNDGTRNLLYQTSIRDQCWITIAAVNNQNSKANVVVDTVN